MQYTRKSKIEWCDCGTLQSMIYWLHGKSEHIKVADANVCYIFGFNPDRYIHCHSCKSHLWDIQGKKIAATTRNSDGWLKKLACNY